MLRRSEADKKVAEPQYDLFADFNGLPNETTRTEFYQHDANWSNRMILGDSLQAMTPPETRKRNIGFQLKEKQVRNGKKKG